MVINQQIKAQGFVDRAIQGYANAFHDIRKDIMSEGTDLTLNPQLTLLNESANASLKDFFTENAGYGEDLDQHEKNDELEMMEAQYDNDRSAVLEYASVGGYNPVIGLTFPMHKLLLMNCIFDNGRAVEKVVTKTPKFTIVMQNRYLITPSGQKLDLSIDQLRLTDAVNSTRPFKEIEVTLPESGNTNILNALGGIEGTDNLSIDTYISAVKVSIDYKAGDVDSTGATIESDVTKEDWLEVHLDFKPSYNHQFERSFMQTIDFSRSDKIITSTVKTDTINATMHNNRFIINANSAQTGTPIIKAVKIKAKKDASNGLLETCTTRWEQTTSLVEIDTATPINVPLSSEEIKDIGALYNIDQLSMTMTMIKEVLQNYKDDTIREGLNESWRVMDKSLKRYDSFDMKPRNGYALDPVTWRNAAFMDIFDTHVTKLLTVLNDPDVSVTIFGAPDLIRKIKPTNYDFSTPSAVGSVPLNFSRGVVTTDNRVYNFMSSQKLAGLDEFIVILRPRNTNRIIYRIYDYQFFVSNEIRNVKFYTLPAVSAYERFKFMSYQPVQGRMKILNQTGYDTVGI